VCILLDYFIRIDPAWAAFYDPHFDYFARFLMSHSKWDRFSDELSRSKLAIFYSLPILSGSAFDLSKVDLWKVVILILGEHL
jgi:hypothetical protein